MLLLYCKIFSIKVIIVACQESQQLPSLPLRFQTALVVFFMRTPFAYNWNQAHNPDGNCGNQIALYLATDVMNLVTDVGVLITPTWHFYRLPVPLYSRLALIGTFTVGGM